MWANYRTNLGKAILYTYTLRGVGEETFRSRFTYFGYQYVFITGAWTVPEDVEGASTRPILLQIESDFVTSAYEDLGSFETDNPLLNDIDAMVDRSVRSNLQSVLTDCPHRGEAGLAGGSAPHGTLDPLPLRYGWLVSKDLSRHDRVAT